MALVDIVDNYSITKLFVSKRIAVTINDNSKSTFFVNLKTVRDFYEDLPWNGTYHLFTMDFSEWKKMFVGLDKFTECYEYIKFVIFELGMYKQYRDVAVNLQKYMKEIISDIDIDFQKKEIMIMINKEQSNNTILLTSEIWNYVVYLLKLSQGEKVTQPRTFNSPEEKAFYLKQQEYDKRIKKIRQDGKSKDGEDKDGLIKTCLYVIYAFPSITFDYLFDQTMAQIYWLQKMAAGSISYSFNEKAFAAGNMKKGKTLDFFIK